MSIATHLTYPTYLTHPTHPCSSERHLEAELPLPRHERRAGVLVRRREQRRRRRGGCAQRAVVTAVVRVVEQVEHFGHELHSRGAGELDVLGHVQIDLVERQPLE